jgi:hypothetical protein
MLQSPLRLIKGCVEYIENERLFELLASARGMYVLYRGPKGPARRGRKGEVVYVGMAGQGSIRARLKLHRRRKDTWTHFSVFEVWDNIRDEEIRELEGLFRHIYKRDTRVNPLNLARGFKPMASVKNPALLGRVKKKGRDHDSLRR